MLGLRLSHVSKRRPSIHSGTEVMTSLIIWNHTCHLYICWLTLSWYSSWVIHIKIYPCYNTKGLVTLFAVEWDSSTVYSHLQVSTISILQYLSQRNVYLKLKDINSKIVFEIYPLEFTAAPPLGQWVTKRHSHMTTALKLYFLYC